MSISKETILKIADLAKLEIDKDEEKRLTHELQQILDYFSSLQEVDTKDVEGTNQVTGLTNIFRNDQVQEYPEEKRKKLFQDTLRVKDKCIIVPKIINN
ncbi:MAG: hypothetical protein A2233_00740 [Candidatus Kerfeldbacteria bacterium RIFOXYA2_FULL_38_24]|uniref:Aspartyl/glutamyl-tRNA(Asn/Gln) amidotransferase subunit C n=1 Tax=Candidatus Kerfeldbacteria bacterium RIFOXYB2_FULL_38_14 TaxID=1798547 RepID=A0A1G2BFX1_9BACT|nr:MAG: hypothetical protein A2233_00740 [Candidatus Kerfeldbacteria bacterium RIFOXYA2_FULL_38_24]OGY88081.1 MAG: hypothetical protein A2319_01470 [Candidatus Kerfeldbacteria bacterium RIFOXYB2_FULL_38_14]OGY88439.1 MAG: hypothetical protein A2458_02345 [Candidatus Kerfeldbacteria bacterium RIFOXYC2_FULL_38_9]